MISWNTVFKDRLRQGLSSLLGTTAWNTLSPRPAPPFPLSCGAAWELSADFGGFIFRFLPFKLDYPPLFIDTEEALTPENVNRNIGQVREITANRLSVSLSSAKDAVKSMKESINQVSSGEIIGESKAAEDEKEEKEEKLLSISTGEVEEE